MIRDCRGILYAGLPDERLRELDIGRPWGSDVMRSYVYVAVDALDGVTTGISAADRTRTILALMDPASQRSDFRTPGHVVPAAIDMGGDVARFYLTESVQELVTLAGEGEGIALTAVLNDDGHMASVDELHDFAARHDCPIIDVAEVLRSRRRGTGWQAPWKGTRSVSLVHLRRHVALRARDAHRVREVLRISIMEFCMDGHVLGVEGECRDRLHGAVEALGDGDLDALAVTRDTSSDEDTHRCDRRGHYLEPLADLLAADLAAAVALTETLDTNTTERASAAITELP